MPFYNQSEWSINQSIHCLISINRPNPHALISKHYVPIFCWRFFQVIRHVDDFHIRRWGRREIPSRIHRRWSQFLDISVQRYFVVCHIVIFTDIIECCVFFRRLQQILRAVRRIVRHCSLTNAALKLWNLARRERSRKKKTLEKRTQPTWLNLFADSRPNDLTRFEVARALVHGLQLLQTETDLWAHDVVYGVRIYSYAAYVRTYPWPYRLPQTCFVCFFRSTFQFLLLFFCWSSQDPFLYFWLSSVWDPKYYR